MNWRYFQAQAREGVSAAAAYAREEAERYEACGNAED